MALSGLRCALLALSAAILLPATAEAYCRFAEMAFGQEAAGVQHGRHLHQDTAAGPLAASDLEATPLNNSGKAAALTESAVRTKATMESIDAYIKKAAPINLKDLLTPVGNFTDASVFWDSFTTFSRYVPGAIVYTVKSIPDMLDDARAALQTKWTNDALMARLDQTFVAMFKALEANFNPTVTGLALRLAFHDAATWNPFSPNKGGANGSIRFEFDWPSNAGLQRFLWPIIWAAKQELDKVLPKPVSYADLCAIAGAVGVYQTHGPLINVGYGRPDVTGPDPFQGVGSNTNQQRDYPIQEIINEWESYGFDIEQLVTLSGGHSIGFSASTNPQGTISSNDRQFGNKYYKQVILGDAFFGSDRALADNNATLAYVEAYAADQELFFQKFSEQYYNLTWLGVDPSVVRLGV